MSDFADQAAEQEAMQLASALAVQARRTPHGTAAEFCVDCGDRIPELRRRAVPGTDRCIDCAERFEKGRRVVR